MPKDEAVALGKTDWWKTRTADEIVRFQLFEERLCMDFGDFQMAVQEALGRPVWTHEFADDERLKAEFLGDREPPTMQEILDMIPEAKRIVVAV